MDDRPSMRTRRYLSYLLRLWRENDGGAQTWRASLERPQDGERLVFPSLDDLFAFLDKETGSDSPGPLCSEEGPRFPGDDLNHQA